MFEISIVLAQIFRKALRIKSLLNRIIYRVYQKKFPSKFISKWTKIRTDEGGVQNGIKKFDFVF